MSKLTNGYKLEALADQIHHKYSRFYLVQCILEINRQLLRLEERYLGHLVGYMRDVEPVVWCQISLPTSSFGYSLVMRYLDFPTKDLPSLPTYLSLVND